MSTPMPSSTLAAPLTGRAARSATWLREPLLHFVLLGGALFAVDHLLASREGDPHTIVMGAAVDAEASAVFAGARGRNPDAEELRALRQVWLDNEVLFREGLAMQMDKGDVAIRDRVIFKALNMIEAGVKLPPITDAQLRDWFEAHRVKYDLPRHYTFQEAVLDGDSAESAVRAFVHDLENGTPGDAKAGLRVFRDRPHANLVTSYGAEFPKALEEIPPGSWRALKTRDGWRAIRFESVTAAKPAVYEQLRNIVMQDWRDAATAEQRTAGVRALATKYRIVTAQGAK